VQKIGGRGGFLFCVTIKSLRISKERERERERERGCCLMSNFLVLSWGEQVKFNEML
jgi:hypothetical protein